jgi:transcriptional regulator with XRE-family HTH domain
MARVAREAGVQRETLYRSLSSQGNPTFDTLSSILAAIGVKIDFSPLGSVGTSIPTPPAVAATQPQDRPAEDAGPNVYRGYSDFNSLSKMDEGAALVGGNEIWSDMGALYAVGSNH